MKAIYENEGVHVQSAPTCYLCENRGNMLYPNLDDRLFGAPGTWNLMRCPGCGLVWLDPRPVPEDIGKLYTEYFTHAVANVTPDRLAPLRKAVKRSILTTSFGYKDLAMRRAGQVVGQILSWVGPLRDIVGRTVMWLEAPRRGRLLDVGCGSGWFLTQMRDLGWEVTGVEPDLAAVKAAHDSFGLDVICSTLEEAAFSESTFDAVTMNHVIEHVPDPISTLRECQRVLKKGGRLVVVTPNIESLGQRWFGMAWRGLELPRHLFLFSPRTLKVCAKRAGLRVEEVRTTAKEARFIWHASRIIRRDGVLPGGGPKHPSLHLRLEGLLFRSLEHLLAKVRPWGEEIVMVASKGEEA